MLEAIEVREGHMDPEDKAAWCAALRSGEYKQGHGVLHRINPREFCCLGVYAHIKGLESSNRGDELIAYKTPTGFNGFKVEIPGVSQGHTDQLMRMNDGSGPPVKSFSEIADWIEENL